MWQAITSEGEIAALIIVYVDDYLVVGSAEACLLSGYPPMVFNDVGNNTTFMGYSNDSGEIPWDGDKAVLINGGGN